MPRTVCPSAPPLEINPHNANLHSNADQFILTKQDFKPKKRMTKGKYA